MKQAVIFGAGNIGRGFIGQLLSRSGYAVTFIEVNPVLVARLSTERRYPVRFVSDVGDIEEWVGPVDAVDGRDADAVARALSRADLAATAVGVAILPRIAPAVAGGLRRRWEEGNHTPLNFLICENLIHADRVMRQQVLGELPEWTEDFVDARVGFVETSIGRMVPAPTPDSLEGNALRVCVEAFGELPVDRNGFVGGIPEVGGMKPFAPFDFYIHRKLYIHNLGHAVCAYLGARAGYRYIWEAVGDPEIRILCRGAMLESARALAKVHAVDPAELQAHVDDLLARFANRKLGDPIERVAREPERKLAPEDRLVGAMRLCLRHGVEPVCILYGIAAALCYGKPGDGPVADMMATRGPEAVLTEICGLSPDTWEWEGILGFVHAALRRVG